jgi:hypothetical protein
MFRSINYARMLYEALRNYLSVTKVYFVDGTQYGGLLSDLYKYLLSCLYMLQSPWDSFEIWRAEKYIIANCKWQIGQLTNVLNYFFDSIQLRIYITQSRTLNLFAPTIAYESTTYAPTIAYESTTYASMITEATSVIAGVNFHVPSDVFNDPIAMGQLISVIEQVKITGINYVITEII